MKTILLALAMAMAASTLLTACGTTTPPRAMTSSQLAAYNDHRRWDYEADFRKDIDTENRR